MLNPDRKMEPYWPSQDSHEQNKAFQAGYQYAMNGCYHGVGQSHYGTKHENEAFEAGWQAAIGDKLEAEREVRDAAR
jgi:ribosome modulation factor